MTSFCNFFLPSSINTYFFQRKALPG